MKIIYVDFVNKKIKSSPAPSKKKKKTAIPKKTKVLSDKELTQMEQRADEIMLILEDLTDESKIEILLQELESLEEKINQSLKACVQGKSS